MQGTAQIVFLDGEDAATSKAWLAGDRDVRAPSRRLRHLASMLFEFDVRAEAWSSDIHFESAADLTRVRPVVEFPQIHSMTIRGVDLLARPVDSANQTCRAIPM